MGTDETARALCSGNSRSSSGGTDTKHASKQSRHSVRDAGSEGNALGWGACGEKGHVRWTVRGCQEGPAVGGYGRTPAGRNTSETRRKLVRREIASEGEYCVR